MTASPVEKETRPPATRREELASWLTSADNPYFARSYVNRIWGYMTGRGIIEPLDDIRAGNPPTNPELLDYLTSQFVESGFNTRHIVSLICKSRTYQLSVASNQWNEDDQINFSHARARRLPAEVLYDAIYRTTGALATFAGVAPGTRASTLPDVGIELPDGFLGNLGRPARETSCECERSSNLQLGPIMALVSGPTVGNAISDPDNAVAKLVGSVQDNSDLVSRLFLRFLNRPGNADELNATTSMFEQLDTDHAKIVSELDTYAKDLAPKIAERELERQGRVVNLQAQIDVERELVALRRPRLEQERQAKIAAARDALTKRDQKLAAKLPQWEASQKNTAWQLVEPVEMDATNRAKLTRQPDGSIFVEGEVGKGVYRIVAPIPVSRITGLRLEAIADDRLPQRGPGRSGDGNFVVTEFSARLLNASAPMKLVRSWDFAGSADDWQTEDGAKVLADSGQRYVFGNGQQTGMKTEVKAPAGNYLVEIVTGVRSAAAFKVQWSTTNQPAFDDARAARRALRADEGGRITAPIAISTDQELTGLRIVVEGEDRMLPIDAIRLFSTDGPAYENVGLQNAQATFSQDAYAIASAIDGNSDADGGNGWAIAPQIGRDQTATFELAAPIDAAKDQLLELSIHQNFLTGQHALGRFRISVTDAAAPVNFGLPLQIAAVLAKPADQRNDADRELLMSRVREGDKRYQKLKADLAAAEQPLPEDPRLKELTAQLAQAQQPLPVDGKLQQLRRAVALSEEQMKNKRLTVAQDIVWALINSPSFLYNH